MPASADELTRSICTRVALAKHGQRALGSGHRRQRHWGSHAQDRAHHRSGHPGPVSHYCHVTRAGPHVWVAGVVGQAQDGSIPSDVVAQFDIAVAVMDKCLKAAGAGPEHVVKVQVFMTDITERPRINPRRIAYFGDNRPASTLVEVKGLVDPRMKVEIECQAYVE